MTNGLPLVAALAGLAVVDSVNPSVTTAHLWLLLRTGSVCTGLWFVAGVFTANVAGGLLLLGGLSLLTPPLWLSRIFPLAVGLGMWTAAFFAWNSQPAGHGAGSKRWTPLQAGGFAALMTLVEMPTAAPYFSALALISSAPGGSLSQGALLGFYNSLFVLPLVVIVLVFWLKGRRGGMFLRDLHFHASKYGGRLLAVLLFALGACFLWVTLSMYQRE